jgi:hypothetical protein
VDAPEDPVLPYGLREADPPEAPVLPLLPRGVFAFDPPPPPPELLCGGGGALCCGCGAGEDDPCSCFWAQTGAENRMIARNMGHFRRTLLPRALVSIVSSPLMKFSVAGLLIKRSETCPATFEPQRSTSWRAIVSDGNIFRLPVPVNHPGRRDQDLTGRLPLPHPLGARVNIFVVGCHFGVSLK